MHSHAPHVQRRPYSMSLHGFTLGNGMGIRGFIELTPELDQDTVQGIVDAAHRVSKEGRVLLILSDVPLDDALIARARDAELVIADSEKLSAALLSSGVLHMRAQEGVFYLRSLAPADETDPPGPPPSAGRMSAR